LKVISLIEGKQTAVATQAVEQVSAKRGRYTKALQLKFPEWRIDPVLASINVPVAYDDAHPVKVRNLNSICSENDIHILRWTPVSEADVIALFQTVDDWACQRAAMADDY
jgi:hypothetical protein